VVMRIQFLFQIEREWDETKRYWKMKRRQQTRLASIRMKCEMAKGVAMLAGGEAAPGRKKGAYDVNRAHPNLTGPKNKKITQSIELLQMDGKDLNQ
jgi:hypothetical protein